MDQKKSAHKRTVINGLLTVKQTNKLSNNLIRIIFSCDKQLQVDPLWIGPHLKLLFPHHNQTVTFPQVNEENKIIWQAGMRERVRTYSIRQYEAVTNLLTIDFVVHQNGVATQWAKQAQEGDVIGLLAMGSKKQFNLATQLVLLGDISAMPAISYTLEQLPKGQKAMAIIEIANEQDKIDLNLSSPLAHVQWLITAPGASQLPDMVTKLAIEQDDSHVLFWGGMESTISQQLRRLLKDKFPHLSGDAIQLISYWREGFAEGEFKHHD